MRDGANSSVSQHQATMYDPSSRSGFDGNQPDGRVTPSKRLSNTINRRSPSYAGQCPFSDHMNGDT